MEIKNNYRYVVTDRTGTIDANPLRERDFSIDWEREDELKYFYGEQFNGKLVFTKEMFYRLKRIERSIYICTTQRMQIYRLCADGVEKEIFDGEFRLTDAQWDDDKCQVELKFLKNTPDKCFNKNKAVKIDLLDITNRKEVNTTTAGGGVFDIKNYSQNTHSDEGGYPYWGGAGDPYAQNYTAITHRALWQTTSGSSDGVYSARTTWVREIVTIDCAETPAPDWVLVEDNCPTNKKYAKQVNTYDCQNYFAQDDFGYERSFDCNYIGSSSGQNNKIDNGVLLSDVLNLFKDRFCPELTVVSDFFQINPENPSGTNYVTNKATQVNNLMLFQKSDVKRFNATGNATKAEWTFEKLMECLNFMFNVSYFIDNGIFRIEHISWFSRNTGLNLTDDFYKKYVNGLNKYSYDMDGLPRSETWRFKEQIDGGLWAGVIDYNNACALSDANQDQTYVIDELMTDVPYAIANSDKDSKNVEDTGFVMMATRIYNGEYYIITTQYLNDSLAWSNLVPNYHYHNRPMKEGQFNGVDVEFITTKPLKKGEKLTVPLCCGINFDPNNKVITMLGEGIVDKAVYNFGNETLDLDLMYNVFENLIDNMPPVFEGANLTTYMDITKFFPLNVTDEDGTIQSIQITYPPAHGTVEIISTTQARYIPNPGFQGWDFFHLQAKDNWGEDSNRAIFMITVLPPNQPPVAVDDLYTVYQGTPFNNYLSIFANDTDDNGFTLITPNVVTAQGVAISINPSTGLFNYTPPPTFEGDDTFQYTIADNEGLTSTATVTLRVLFRNKPVTNPDYYSTQKNVILSINGTSVGQYALQANDYVPDGSGGALYCDSDIKATAQGGTVTILTNGHFIYEPAPDFVGQDSFTYVVNNANGSAVGTAYVSVIPTVYVKLVWSNDKFNTKPKIFCDQGLVPGGSYRTRDYTVYFYADSAGTVPINVDVNWGLRINYRQTVQQAGSCAEPTQYYDDQTSVVSGTSHVIYRDFIYTEIELRCNQPSCDTDTATSLISGGYVIIT